MHGRATLLFLLPKRHHSSETDITCRRAEELSELGTGVSDPAIASPRTLSRTVRAPRMHHTIYRHLIHCDDMTQKYTLPEHRLQPAFMHLRRTDDAWDLSPEGRAVEHKPDSQQRQNVRLSCLLLYQLSLTRNCLSKHLSGMMSSCVLLEASASFLNLLLKRLPRLHGRHT